MPGDGSNLARPRHLGELPGIVRRAGSFRLSHHRAHSADQNVAHSLYIFGVWGFRDHPEYFHVRIPAKSFRVLAPRILVDIPARGHPAIDRAFNLQLAAQIFIRDHGRSDDAFRAHRFGDIGIPIFARNTITSNFDRWSLHSVRHFFDIETGQLNK